MDYITNRKIYVDISPKGAELQSIRDEFGYEYLWQGSPKYWAKRAPTLFPYIGRLTEGRYTYQGKEHQLPIHGFLPTTDMSVETKRDDSIVYFLKDSAELRHLYPFAFELRVGYALEESTINVRFDVRNTGDCEMFFGVGGHPAFNTPLEFTDYFLEFSEPCQPIRVGFSDNHFVSGTDTAYPLQNDREIHLAHNLFDDDAIVLKNTSGSVTLRYRKNKRAVKVEYPDMPYVGFWHAIKMDAPYVCIEPWSSLPSREGVVEELSEQKDLIVLPAGEKYVSEWKITVF